MSAALRRRFGGLLAPSTIGLALLLLAVAFLATASLSPAQREPVLKQIDVPHPYYFREMYLPQLTTGPSAVAWAADSRSVVYSMAGSLWQQKLDSTAAQQITAGPGYDYQPDCSSDGRWVVYASYLKDAVELWALDLETKATRQLTTGRRGQPRAAFLARWQAHRICFHVIQRTLPHLRRAISATGELKNVQRLTGENRSPLPRYYYSQFDHEISPAWSPDGKEILFVSNRGHIYGTGGFWRMKAKPGAEAHEIHYEETTWKARPDFSPDGKRIVYASYLGQQWHQLWVMPSEGGDAFPLSYGDFDNVGAALVSGWKAHRIHFESRRQHFLMDRGNSRRRTDSTRREREALSEAGGAAKHCGT